MPAVKKARAIGFNHIALEVGDIDEALAFYGRLFEFTLRGKDEDSAFIDLGDQFLALQKGRKQPADDGRHFGLVVDDKEAVRKALADAGIEPVPGLPRPVGKPHRDRRLLQYPVHQGPERAAWHGADASVEEQIRPQGTHRKGYVAGLTSAPAGWRICPIDAGPSGGPIDSRFGR
jgi:catechol 2,3-dioxygenase-like lactoylglutathione lyase family enzyme